MFKGLFIFGAIKKNCLINLLKNEKVFHFDFYRINKEEEALDMGIEEYFYSNNWCLLEWPNKVENLLPLKSVNITITLNSNQLRTIEVLNNE